jgi:hypothetical protein
MKSLKSLIVFITTGTMAVVLAACYGAPVNEMYHKLVKARDASGEPINGLKVTMVVQQQDSLTEYTDSTGSAQFTLYQDESPAKFVLEDVDGELNGGEFLKKEVNDDTTEVIDVTMDRKATK